MAYFLLKLLPPRPSFPADARPEEMDAMARHAEFWQRHAKAGAAIAVGPVFDGEGAWGMAIVETPDAGAARMLADDDPVSLADLGFEYIVSPIQSLILRDRQAQQAE